MKAICLDCDNEMEAECVTVIAGYPQVLHGFCHHCGWAKDESCIELIEPDTKGPSPEGEEKGWTP